MRVCCLFIAACFSAAYASTAGTKFQMVFVENAVDYADCPPLEVFVSNTGNNAAEVTVSTPRNHCASQTQTVGANSVVKFEVCSFMMLQAGDYWPAYKTVLVESNNPVMVYGFNKEKFSADAFFAIPNSELAFSYYLTAFDPVNIATQFAVSATASNTNVMVILPPLVAGKLPVQVNYKGSVFRNGQSFTMVIDQYETYLGKATGDLTGTRVLANQEISVYSSNVRSKDSSDSRDHLASQLVPTGKWSTKFAFAPVPRTTRGDTVRIMGRVINTSYRIRYADGSPDTLGVLLKPGNYADYYLEKSAVIMTDDNQKPLQITQMVRSQAGPKISDVADPTMFYLVAQNQWLNDYLAPALVSQLNLVAYDVNYAFIAVADGQEGGIRIDGNSISPSWTRIDGIASAWVAVNGNSHRYTHTSNQNFGVMVYGATDRESYGFALGANLATNECQDSLSTQGDSVDNDCDGTVDEELCDKIDNDGDGLIDEDCRQAATEAVGNEYVLMFIENEVTDGQNVQEFIEIYVSSANSSKGVTYSIKTPFPDKDVIDKQIAAKEVDIFFQKNKDLIHLGNGVDNKAITVTADDDIVVYGVNKFTFSTDAFLAFPVDVVGSEYYSAHYYPGDDRNQFGFTPVQNDGSPTVVEVTLPSNNVGGSIQSSANFEGQLYQAGQKITVTLAYGQTAQFQAESASHNLNGAYIKSDKPISAFSGNVRAKVEPDRLRSRDHLVQQLSPVDTWGMEFVTLPAPREDLQRGDVFFVTASTDNTNLNVEIKMPDGSSRNEQYNIASRGNYQELAIGTEEYAHINASNPVQVFQYVKTSNDRNTDPADPAMLMIPPVEQWSRNYQFITPRTGQLVDKNIQNDNYLEFTNFVMIAIRTVDKDGLLLDDEPLPPGTTWIDLAGSDYSAVEVEVNNAVNRHSLIHTDDTVMFQALMYGRADRESYALPLGMRLATCTRSPQSPGDGKDNDCDGSIDEELCDGVDNDLDGTIDEDCSGGEGSGFVFYVTYMENTVEYSKGFDLELYAAVVGNSKARISVTAPKVDFPNYDIIAEVQPKEVYSFGFAPRLRNEGQGITGNTIYINSGTEIVVYGVNKEKFSNDAFLVYPESSLGTNYYTCSWAPSTLPTEFAVVATQDNTQVTITLPSGRADLSVEANGQNYSAGDSFTVTLNQFEVYQGQSSGDLTGTRVQTTIRAAVFSGNVRTKVELSGSRDHLVQQMLRTESYGTDFSVIPFPGRTVGDVIKIVARQPNTVISVNGVAQATLNAGGEVHEYRLPSTEYNTITASQPVMVVQFVKSQDGRDNPEEADPAMFVVPSNDNFISEATFVTPIYSGGRVPGADYINYLTLVIQSGQQGNLRLNDLELSAALSGDITWTSISSSSYITATFTVSSGRAHTVSTTSGTRFYGRLYGRADRESYAFPVGFRFI